MTLPYLLISDLHLHEWSAFSKINSDGQNSRLVALLQEIRRAATTLSALGGRRIVIAGDLFHVRGQLSPQVLNPVMDLFRDLIAMGFKVEIIAGNHDLATKEWTRLGSGVTALEGLGCTVVSGWTLSEDGQRVLVNWRDSVADLKRDLCEISNEIGDCLDKDLIIHAPIDGVILGIPDHGLTADWLAKLGYKRVFAGHYHNHVSFPGQVYSIGAIAHHSWSDVGSQAGFCIVHENQVDFHPSALPQFVDVSQETPVADIPGLVAGNFARVKVTTSKIAEIEKMREYLTKAGALGTVIIPIKKPADTRDTSTGITAGASVEKSVSDFIKSMKFDKPGKAQMVQLEAAQVLADCELA